MIQIKTIVGSKMVLTDRVDGYFETIVVPVHPTIKDWRTADQIHYKTESEARIGHSNIVAKLEAGSNRSERKDKA